MRKIIKNCNVDDCKKPYHSSGYCKNHYEMKRIHGDPLYIYQKQCRPIVLTKLSNGCIICTSHKPWAGIRPAVKRGGKPIFLGHYFWEQKNGKVPNGLVLRHKCDYGACVNVDHLETGTQADNIHDAVRRGRHCAGERHGCSKLNNESVKNIRSSKLTNIALANLYDLNKETISRVRRFKSWKHV